MAVEAFQSPAASERLYRKRKRGPQGHPDIMGQNYAKYCHVSGMLKYPVECFEATKAHREVIHGPTDFVLMIKGTKFQCHKTVLMSASRYFETMLTMFDERSKSEVELKDIVEVPTMALALHFVYDGNLPTVRKRILTKKNVHDILQLAIYLQIQALQSHCCRYVNQGII